ncbi:MAG: hypothetical protein K2O28_01665 [Clostridia bacterium]|nr:hypothetical protein [Clostridia bacterium]
MGLTAEKHFSLEQINEKRVTRADMINEFIPLMEDFFEGEFVTNDPRGIKYRLPNGQRYFIQFIPMAR